MDFLDFLHEVFCEQPLMDYPAQVRKSANLHIQDGCHGLICIFKINMNTDERSPVVNILPILAIFFLNTL